MSVSLKAIFYAGIVYGLVSFGVNIVTHDFHPFQVFLGAFTMTSSITALVSIRDVERRMGRERSGGR